MLVWGQPARRTAARRQAPARLQIPASRTSHFPSPNKDTDHSRNSSPVFSLRTI